MDISVLNSNNNLKEKYQEDVPKHVLLTEEKIKYGTECQQLYRDVLTHC
jgi:hypothetical protein